MIIVTGGSGYVGSHIVKKLVEAGKKVRTIVYSSERTEKEKRLENLDVEIVEGDVTKPESLRAAFDGGEGIIHTVAIAIEKGKLSYELVNAQGTLNVLKAAESVGIKRFINISQLGADPGLPYRFLASKGLAQKYVTESDLDWTAFRPSVIWGPEDEFANTFAKLVPITPIIFPIIDKNVEFQPVWVEDVATAVVRAVEDPGTIGKEYELGGPEILSLLEIEKRTLEALGAKRIMIPFPKFLLNLIVFMMESILPSPPVTRSLLELLAVDNTTQQNAMMHFVGKPRPFTTENIKPYMINFRVRQTISQFLGK
jgi:NADH dehydrogenase